jgi:diamine N-acetyltransferase
VTAQPGADPSLELRPIDEHNRERCLALELQPGQERFVTAIARSLAQAAENPAFQPRGLYAGDTMVGFAMYGVEPNGEFWLYRLMIDRTQQRRGYGRRAVELVARLVPRDPHAPAATPARALYLCVAPANTGARALYESMGFEPTGEVDEDDEVVYCLRW